MQELLKQIPKTDKLLAKLTQMLGHKADQTLLKRLVLEFLNTYRKNLLESNENKEILSLELCAKKILQNYENLTQKSLKPLINATGIIIHTNLGRSVFSEDLLEEIKPILTHYNNLEYDLQEGKRSERYAHLRNLFRLLLNVEDVLVVNNNAAAVFLILNTFAKDKEVILSRSELIEIGGSFRIPKVMENAGAILREVGTTNKTYLKDYEEALCENTALLFKAHKSNYAITGFTEEVDFTDLTKLARKHRLIDYYDLGSGYFGIHSLEAQIGKFEPSLQEITRHNPSLVSFSGDKLLGGAQAGIILGKKNHIERLKKNQLLRMLRVDKFTIAALEATLCAYLTQNFNKIPSLSMLLESKESLQESARSLARALPQIFQPQVITTQSYSGGGALPNHSLESFGVAIYEKNLKKIHLNLSKLEKILRTESLIARLENNALILDVRTLLKGDAQKIVQIFKKLEQGIICKQI